jgi:uncharacterized protein (TIGR00369 family)
MTLTTDAPGTPRDVMVETMPLNRHLGLVFDGRADGAAHAHFDVTDAVLAFGALHAGSLYCLLDAVCALALLPSLSEDQHPVTHDIHVSVMRSASKGDRCDLIGRVIKLGRSLAFVEARAEVGGKVIATARVTKSLTVAAKSVG